MSNQGSKKISKDFFKITWLMQLLLKPKSSDFKPHALQLKSPDTVPSHFQFVFSMSLTRAQLSRAQGKLQR